MNYGERGSTEFRLMHLFCFFLNNERMLQIGVAARASSSCSLYFDSIFRAARQKGRTSAFLTFRRTYRARLAWQASRRLSDLRHLKTGPRYGPSCLIDRDKIDRRGRLNFIAESADEDLSTLNALRRAERGEPVCCVRFPCDSLPVLSRCPSIGPEPLELPSIQQDRAPDKTLGPLPLRRVFRLSPSNYEIYLYKGSAD